MPTKTAPKQGTIPLPIVVLLVLVAAGMAAGGLGKTTNKPPKPTTGFEVDVEWHQIHGGVRILVTQNGRTRIDRRYPETGTPRGTKNPIFHFGGHVTDVVIVVVRPQREDFLIPGRRSLFAAVEYLGPEPSTPVAERDPSPTLDGLHVRYPNPYSPPR